MDTSLLIVMAGGILGGFVQGLSGFGFGLAAMSLWIWFLAPELAAVLVVSGALAGQLWTAILLRGRFHWHGLWPYLLGAAVGVPAGALLLPLLDAHGIRFLLGLFLVLWCPAMLLWRDLPPVRGGGQLADASIGALGGFMGGLGGFTGPIPTLWCTLRAYPRHQQRALIQGFNLFTLAGTLAIYLERGQVRTEMYPAILLLVPCMLLPSLLGQRLYACLPDLHLRRLILVLLTLTGAVMLLSALPHLGS